MLLKVKRGHDVEALMQIGLWPYEKRKRFLSLSAVCRHKEKVAFTGQKEGPYQEWNSAGT